MSFWSLAWQLISLSPVFISRLQPELLKALALRVPADWGNIHRGLGISGVVLHMERDGGAWMELVQNLGSLG